MVFLKHPYHFSSIPSLSVSLGDCWESLKLQKVGKDSQKLEIVHTLRTKINSSNSFYITKEVHAPSEIKFKAKNKEQTSLMKGSICWNSWYPCKRKFSWGSTAAMCNTINENLKMNHAYDWVIYTCWKYRRWASIIPGTASKNSNFFLASIWLRALTWMKSYDTQLTPQQIYIH